MVSGGTRGVAIAAACAALLLPGAATAVDERPATPDRFAHTVSKPDRARPFAVDLSGEWKLKLGDDPAWSDPGFDDSSWTPAQVPQQHGHEEFKEYDGFAWYRLEFFLRPGARGTPLVAALGGIDDADETYLNGHLIGHTGQFPPNADSQWFEKRLYPVPAGVPRFGERNVLAVRMNDMNGGGGWYGGPVGLYSKDALRSAMYGLDTAPAGRKARHQVKALLKRQARAVRKQQWTAYRRTLARDFFHEGDTRERRLSELQALSRQYGPLRLRDTELEVVRDRETGALVADTNRTLVGQDAEGRTVVVEELHQDFLYFEGKSRLRERGNRSRFFIDSVDSGLERREREFAVYLPPSYLENPNRRYPTVYMLHGINGGPLEWDVRRINERIDAMIHERGLEESIVIMPDGETLWYVDSSEAPWRSMFATEMVPYVDASYRTIPRREMRGVTGLSMGGHGAFTLGWALPELFSSIASLMGVLSSPPPVGTHEDRLANADETPLAQAAHLPPEFLRRYSYFMDACEDDQSYKTQLEAMSSTLTAKGVPHRTELYPVGGHNDACWLPQVHNSFESHSEHFRKNGL